MKYFLKVEKMTVGYEGKPLIQDIDLTLRQGEILTLIGPNGAGKSTILKSLTRQLKMLCGTVYIGEESLKEMSGSRLSQTMAVVLTKGIRTELMTCEDVVATGRYPYTGRFGLLSTQDRKIVSETMELVNITAIRDQDFTRISDGQRQRVLLARALCQKPQVIVLDEPTSYLDIRYKLEFLSILQRMKRERNLTVIMSLHELELAERISDQILCVNGRYVDRYGSPDEIFQEGYIKQLFSIDTGYYDEENEDIELEKAQGTPRVFIIAGGGSGRGLFRHYQRQGIPFYTGIIAENDLDYPVAKALSAKAVCTQSFEPVSDEMVHLAKELIDSCEQVICCRKDFGTGESYNRKLWEYAGSVGKQRINEMDSKG